MLDQVDDVSSGGEDFPVIDLTKREVRKETSAAQAEANGMWKTSSSYQLVYMFLVTCNVQACSHHTSYWVFPDSCIPNASISLANMVCTHMYSWHYIKLLWLAQTHEVYISFFEFRSCLKMTGKAVPHHRQSPLPLRLLKGMCSVTPLLLRLDTWSIRFVFCSSAREPSLPSWT